MFSRINHCYLTVVHTVRRRLSTVADAERDEGAVSAEYLMWIGIAVAIAITVGAIVTALVVAKAHSINLN